MLFLVPLLQLLTATASVQATPLPEKAEPGNAALAIRQPENFQCAHGYILTSYTNTGIATCTKISGSSITPGYSAQTVAVVGLISGITGLLITCLPIGRYFYRAGEGYFRPGTNGRTWESAFPRAIDSDSSVAYYQGDPVHEGWVNTYKALQAEHYDPQSTMEINSDEKGSVAKIFHNGVDIVHNFNIVPHNETHDKWHSFTDVTMRANSSDIARRDVGWTGARVEFEDYAIDGHYSPVQITHDHAHSIAWDMMFGYVAGVGTGNNYDCTYLGTIHPGPWGKFAGLVQILSQVDYSEYFLGSDCGDGWTSGMDEHDELK